jgi:HAD superfamily hydrolase (TIGR01509 family)
VIRAVIFDMDGVLVDSEPLWRKAVADAFFSIGVPLRPEEVLEIQGMRIDALVEYFYRRYAWDAPPQEDVVRLIVDTVVALIGEQGELKEGARSALDFAAERAGKVGLASSSPRRVIQAVIDRLDIASYFDVIHSAETEPYGKPHPAVYLTVAEMLDTPPPACLAVEDSLSGLLSASSAGMKVLYVPDRAIVGDPRLALADAVIPSLAKLDGRLWDRLGNNHRADRKQMLAGA